MRRGLLVTKPRRGTGVQHEKPCRDCPWRRDALEGWLGALTAEDWLAAAHGEANIDCHTIERAQCAGSAIYRANVCKTPRDPSILVLRSDREAVFATPSEFKEYHAGKPKAAGGEFAETAAKGDPIR